MTSPLIFLRGFGIYDDSFYLSMGNAILHGAKPYLHFTDDKTPAIYYLGALLQWLGDGAWWVPRVLLFLVSLANGLLVVEISKKLAGERGGVIAALLFVPSYFLTQGYSLHTEPFCLLFVLLAVTTRARSLLCGFLFGVAFLFKQPALLLAAIFFPRWTYALGFIAAPFLWLLFAYHEGFLGAFWDASMREVGGYALLLPTWQNALSLSVMVPSILVSALALFISRREVMKNVPFWLWGWSVFSVAILFRTLGLNGHYAHLAVAPTCILAAFLLSRIDFPLRKIAVAGTCALGITVLFLSFKMLSGKQLASDIEEMRELRSLLSKHVPPKNELLVISKNRPSILNYMSGRAPMAPIDSYEWGAGMLNLRSKALVLNGRVSSFLWEMPLRYRNKWSEVQEILGKHYYLYLPEKHAIRYETFTVVGVLSTGLPRVPPGPSQ